MAKKMVNNFVLSELPPNLELETKAVLKQTASAYRYLSELKGISKTIPNQGILINTLPLLEAKDSSAIENIITTHDELYKEGLFSDFYNNSAAKEVQNYSEALKTGFEKIKSFGLLTNNIIIEIQNIIEKNNAGFRKLPGTDLRNLHTGKLIYTPPQNNEDIVRLMSNLERFINNDQISDLDILVKMAVIHYQFESIHPFYDGNGRTGRIINILFLVLKGLLDIPVLIYGLDDNVRIIYKKELENIPIFGWGMKQSPFIPVSRGDGGESMKSLNEAISAMKESKSILIYPEGTRSVDGTLGEFKRGAFVLAEKAGKKIVPVTVIGTNKILPKGTTKILKGAKVRIIISEPMELPAERHKRAMMVYIDTIRSIILDNLSQHS